ncbi:MAG: LemA family protein [Chloroflexi bacterium]|nr:MAG: LemA family protein [Chloroflexota bacterium]
MGWIALAIVVAVLLVGVALFYNRFVSLRQQVRAAYSDVDVQLKTNAIAAGAEPPAERATAETALSGALKSLFAVAEAYPQLQAVQEFKDLSSNLTATEDTLQYARRYYNAQVRDYNTAIATFPGLVLAPLMGFTPYQFFEMEAPADRELPKVTFS